jgi:asparagine synthase (glutamine-hydrolysing)
MCAICGVTGERNEAAVRAMSLAMAHRGPDGEGYYLGDGVSLGMRRLSIIDVEGGQQPIANEDETVQMVCNGEIYNFRELRRFLETKGHRFRAGSDAEVIVHLYEEYGEAGIHALRGMFAFALWDERRRKLILGRDRLGIKPLYYATVGERVFFASEVKGLLACPEVRRSVNETMLGVYLTLQYVPGPETLFRGILKVPPGHYLVITGGEVRVVRYWDLVFAEPDRTLKEEEVQGEFEAALRESVSAHLVSDVPLGVLLSGGVDSSVVTALMSREVGARCRTFTVGFPDLGVDERPHARRVAAAFGTDHHELEVQASPADELPKVIWLMDEPVADAAALPTYLICRSAAREVKVLLTGEGGDELCGGYPRYAWLRVARTLHRFLPPLQPDGRVSHLLFNEDRGGWLSRRLVALLCDIPDGERHLRLVANFTREQQRALVSPEAHWWGDGGLALQLVEGVLNDVGREPVVHALMYLDVRTWLVDDVLLKVDRMSMGASVEARVPLLDHRLMELVAVLPHTFKVRGFQTKRLLRQAARGLLPKRTARRRKQAFRVPVARWLREALGDFARDTLLSVRARQRGYFRPAQVALMLDLHQKGRRDYSQALWNLLTLELWHRMFIDGLQQP